MNKYILLFDGLCNFCNFWINFIIKRDKKKLFKFAALQSDRGQFYLNKFNLDQIKLETFILIENDIYHTRSEAALIILKNLPFPNKLLYVFRYMPLNWRDWLYSKIAENRYKLFGQRDSCRLPGPDEIDRFLS